MASLVSLSGCASFYLHDAATQKQTDSAKEALAAITPDNMLHPGYHASLGADVADSATALDPVYPESRTRKQLIDAWRPDSYLNPHGYPSHEWIQPFSEYEAWVQTRIPGGGGRRSTRS